ncbi:MAG: 2OG-Fe dioxygenase family protein [Mycobacterium sp.]|nr:2OG-Fe dioxygenase family protein [Mycobacterium sp.]
MTNISHPPTELGRVHSSMLRQGYAVTSDQAIGLPEKLRDNFVQTYFVDGVIRTDEGDLVIDRKRARDVIYYEWHDGDLQLEEYETIRITDRGRMKGERIPARVTLLDDPQAVELIKTFLTLIPPGRRQSKGTFGVNLFRTYTNVVTVPHRDDEEFTFIYVLNRVGDGATTHLYDIDADTIDFEQQLQPGELIVIDDERYLHDASPLEPDADGRAMRDALVCTVDYETSYLRPGSKPRSK